jgi:hypothetical protein
MVDNHQSGFNDKIALVSSRLLCNGYTNWQEISFEQADTAEGR